MEIVNLIISLISGAVGGNVAGAAAPDKNLGAIGNSIVGLLGGGAGEYILQAVGLLNQAGASTGGSLDIPSILASIGTGGVSGAAITFIVGLIKNSIQKPSS